MKLSPVDYKCKKCGVEYSAKFDPICSEDWLRRLYKLLTCNPCFDKMAERKRARAALAKKCMQLFTNRALQLPVDEARFRQSIATLSRRYAESLAKELNLDTIMWSNEFVDILCESPREVFQHLIFYEENIKKA